MTAYPIFPLGLVQSAIHSELMIAEVSRREPECKRPGVSSIW